MHRDDGTNSGVPTEREWCCRTVNLAHTRIGYIRQTNDGKLTALYNLKGVRSNGVKGTEQIAPTKVCCCENLVAIMFIL